MIEPQQTEDRRLQILRRDRVDDRAVTDRVGLSVGETSPDAAARVVVEAATHPRPRKRYFAPRSAGLQTRLLGLLPEAILDRILLRLYRIESP